MKISKVILASKSPRRRELLDQIKVEYECIPSTMEEIMEGDTPSEIVCSLSKQKISDVYNKIKDEIKENTLIISADTIVAFGDRILGKPRDEQDALEMLTMLSGKAHQVYTGVSIMYVNNGETRMHKFYECSDVFVSELSRENIIEYIATKEPMDKAGSYGIQGYFAKYVEKIDGDYNNIVGLPISRLYREAKDKFNIEL